MDTRQVNRKKNRSFNISRSGTQPWVQRLRYRQNYPTNSSNASASNNYYYRQNEPIQSPYYGRNNYGRPRFNYNNNCRYYYNSNYNTNELQQLLDASSVSFQVVNYEMCFYCFDVLHYHLFPNTKRNSFETAFTDDPYPIFVTWKIGKEKRLRGCIGTFQPINLHRGLREYALTSALRDARFSPISTSELCHLQVCVSILLNFETGNNFMDWQLGVHGIRIEFKNENGSKRSACYLPEVPVEQGWNKTQTIDSLLRKGGYRMQITEAFRHTIILNRFTTEKLSVTYEDYMRYVYNKNNDSNNNNNINFNN